jgi:hypothetical protein
MMVKKKKEIKEQYTIQMAQQNFTENMESLSLFITNLRPVAKEHDKNSVKNTIEKVDEVFKIVGISKKELQEKKSIRKDLKLTDKQSVRIINILYDLKRLTPSNVELLHKSVFVILVSYFDFILSDLIHCFYQMHPESLSGKELSITLKELKLCSYLDEAINYIINKEVDKVLFDNLENQKNYLKSYLKIDIKENIICWNRINEAIERRNIIVHNNGKINRRYLKSADLSVLSDVKSKKLKEGKTIRIDEGYFTTIYNEILIAGTILIQSCWRKWRKEKVSSADAQLNKSMYDALYQEKWVVAEKLGLFAKECEISTQEISLYLNINYCQSLKWQNKKAEFAKEFAKYDISTLSPKYKLALYALKNDKNNFYKNVEGAITIDQMKKDDFMEWPLFRELRKDPDYEEKIKTTFISASQK